MSTFHTAVEFVRSVGIPVRLWRGADGFVPMIEIEAGGLVVDPEAHVSDLLHEAGHLAVIPERFRPTAGGDLGVTIRRMFETLEAEGCEIDSPLMRAAIQSGEQEATAWAWAAGMHLGLPIAEIIRDGDYGGMGASVRIDLQLRQHAGINGLHHARMCTRPEYPRLREWTQKAGNEPIDGRNPYQAFETRR